MQGGAWTGRRGRLRSNQHVGEGPALEVQGRAEGLSAPEGEGMYRNRGEVQAERNTGEVRAGR